MDYTLRETINTTNGEFKIFEVGESIFWQVNHPNERKGVLFYSLNSAQNYIRDTEITPSWDGLFELYVSKNLAVN